MRSTGHFYTVLANYNYCFYYHVVLKYHRIYWPYEEGVHFLKISRGQSSSRIMQIDLSLQFIRLIKLLFTMLTDRLLTNKGHLIVQLPYNLYMYM